MNRGNSVVHTDPRSPAPPAAGRAAAFNYKSSNTLSVWKAFFTPKTASLLVLFFGTLAAGTMAR